MTNDSREVIPLVPRDDLREGASLAPHATPLSDADKRRLAALLRELLRDSAIRKLLNYEDAVSSQPQAGK